MPLVRHLTGKPTFGLLIFRINGQLYSGERTTILDVLLGDQRRVPICRARFAGCTSFADHGG